MRCLLFLLLLTFFLALSLAQVEKSLDSNVKSDESQESPSTVKTRDCPGDCNGNGACNPHNGTCVCNAGFVGFDCANEIINATSGSKFSDVKVSQSQWVFYAISTQRSGGLTIIVNSSAGDVDLYGRANFIPSRSLYTMADTSSSRNFVVTNTNPGTATWYIGLYGYTSATFTIAFNATVSPCPNGCSGHGQCNSHGLCSCYSGYSGLDCSVNATQLSLNTISSTSRSGGSWTFYSYNSQSSSPFAVNVVATAGDPDLYIKFNIFPTLYSYDYRDQTRNNNVTIPVQNPSIGTYYFGVYAYGSTTISFTIKVVSLSSTTTCPNSCSLRGSCSQGICQCNSGFVGTYCQTMSNAMDINTPVSGYVASGLWNYYHFSSFASSDMVVSVSQTTPGPASDCDLYIKSGAIPTTSSYDYANTNTRQNFNVSVLDPGQATWNFGIKNAGWINCTYTIAVTLTSTCPNDCSGNGVCIQGSCACNATWAGDDCSQRGNELNNGATSTNVLTNGTGQWMFYSFRATGGFFAVNLLETNTSGFLWLYVAKDAAPDTRNYDFADMSVNKFHSVTVQTTPSDWNVGVYVNPYALGEVSYSIAAWSPAATV